MNIGKKITALLLCASLSTVSVNVLAGSSPYLIHDPVEILASVAILAGATVGTAGYVIGRGDKTLAVNIAKILGLYVAGMSMYIGTWKLAEKISDYYNRSSNKKSESIC